MRRLGIVAVGLALVVAIGTPTAAAAQSPPPAIIFQACSGGQRSSIGVVFAWSPTPGALQQWVDLSLFDNGFQPGTFLGAPVEIGMETAFWDGIAPELPHFYRVNVLYPDGWVTVASGSFVSIGGCPKPTALIFGAFAECIGGDFHDTTFTWSPGGGDSQWLDFAWSAEEMALGTYHAYGPLSPDTGSYKLRIPNNIPYWWRVNTHSAAGWSPSPVWYFGGAQCPLEAPPAAPPTPVPPPPTPPPLVPPGGGGSVYFNGTFGGTCTTIGDFTYCDGPYGSWTCSQLGGFVHCTGSSGTAATCTSTAGFLNCSIGARSFTCNASGDFLFCHDNYGNSWTCNAIGDFLFCHDSYGNSLTCNAIGDFLFCHDNYGNSYTCTTIGSYTHCS